MSVELDTFFPRGVITDMNKEVIGLSGTNGAGKDTFAEYWLHYTHGLQVSLGDMLRSQLPIDKEPSRANLADLSAELRSLYGLAVLVDIALKQYDVSNYNSLLINGIRHPSEAQRIKDIGGIMIWIDAPIEVRYNRIQQSNRGRFEDNVSFGQFQEQEMREMSANSEASVNLTLVRRLANITLLNDSNKKEDFERQIDELFFR